MNKQEFKKNARIKNSEKTKWLSLLLLATLLFLIGLTTKHYIFYILATSLAFYVRKNGYNALFKEYDNKQLAKRMKAESMMNKIK
ncbi:hypothetical protein [Carnobacterium sp. FSL W8-0810]|uniref:hypothetical protein n=1 Tax=Carnobacterium sp. FSL W8-0810 TaxID=2954705 RepID=UPI0030F6467F